MALKTCTRPAGSVAAYAKVEIRLSQDTVITASGLNYLASVIPVTAAADGSISVQLQATNDLTPNNTYYTVTEYAAGTDSTYYIQVPQTAGPFVLTAIQVSVPPAPAPAGAAHVASLLVDGAATVVGALEAGSSTSIDMLGANQTITGVKHTSAGWFFDAGFTVTAGAVTFATAPTFSLGASFPSGAGIVSFGGGDDVSYYVAGAAFEMDARQGTGASPITTGSGPTFKISRTEQITEASMPAGVGANNQGNAGLWVSALGNSLNEVQVNGVHATAINSSTQSAHNDDACGVNAQGSIQGSGTGYGIGAYIAGRRDTNTGGTNGLEVRSSNYTATDDPYVTNGASKTMGVWATAGGNAPSAVAYVTGFGGSLQTWHVGYAVIAGSVTDQGFRDDSNSATSVLINGTHSVAGLAMGAGNQMLLGGITSVFAVSNNILEIQGSANNVDGLIVMGATGVNNGYQLRARNASGQVSFGVTQSAFTTGAAAGDGFIGARTSGKFMWYGGNPGSTGAAMKIGNDSTITMLKDLRRSRQTPTEAVLVSGVDATAGEEVSVTLTAARVVGAPTNPATGQELFFVLIQNGTGGWAVTWNAAFKVTWVDTGNTLNKRSTIAFRYDGTNWNQIGAQTAYV